VVLSIGVTTLVAPGRGGQGQCVAEKRWQPNSMRKWTFILGLVVLLPLLTLYGLDSRIHAMVRERAQKILQTHFASNVEFCGTMAGLTFPL
jgi:hypothetical protein